MVRYLVWRKYVFCGNVSVYSGYHPRTWIFARKVLLPMPHGLLGFRKTLQMMFTPWVTHPSVKQFLKTGIHLAPPHCHWHRPQLRRTLSPKKKTDLYCKPFSLGETPEAMQNFFGGCSSLARAFFVEYEDPGLECFGAKP